MSRLDECQSVWIDNAELISKPITDSLLGLRMTNCSVELKHREEHIHALYKILIRQAETIAALTDQLAGREEPEKIRGVL